MTFFIIFRGFGDSILMCKECDSKLTVHPECLPIPVPQGDPFFPAINQTTGKPFCLSFTRSMPGQLTLGFREQINQVKISKIWSSNVGLVRTTLRLRVSSFTDWASRAASIIFNFKSKNLHCFFIYNIIPDYLIRRRVQRVRQWPLRDAWVAREHWRPFELDQVTTFV